MASPLESTYSVTSVYKCFHLTASRYVTEGASAHEAKVPGFHTRDPEEDEWPFLRGWCARRSSPRGGMGMFVSEGARDLSEGVSPLVLRSMTAFPQPSLWYEEPPRYHAGPMGARLTPPVAADPLLEQTFLALAARWRKETAVFSSVTRMSMHPAYQRIIGMGPRVLPLIVRELRRERDHWFWALTAITGEDPVPPDDAGDIDKMTEAWLRLAEQREWL